MAYIAVNTGAAASLTLGEKAIALEALGVSTADEQAALLGSTPGSIRQLKSEIRGDRRGSNATGGKSGKKEGAKLRRRRTQPTRNRK
jgi:hypothetical protein